LVELIRKATPFYAAQPFQQLAAAHRAAGHDSDVRRVLMAQRRDQIRRGALSGRGERAWARFTGLTLGYGYQPWRALVGLLAVIVAAVALAAALGDRGGLARADPKSSAMTSCSTVERVGVGLDLGLPLISAGALDRCAPTGTGAGDTITVGGWALQLLAWAFATLFHRGLYRRGPKT
jgi:hypothetical protein